MWPQGARVILYPLAGARLQQEVKMSGRRLQALCAVSLSAMAAIGPASAQSTTRDEVEALKAQINALQQQLRALEKKVNRTEKGSEKTHAAAAPARKASALPVRPASAPPVNTGLDDHQAMPTDSAPPPTAVAKMSPSFRPSICSSDGLNCIAITSRLHFDMGGYH